MKHGYIHIYQGHGKGKTTAAVGCAVRALGAGLHVGWCSFLKTGSASEISVLRKEHFCKVYPSPNKMPFTFQMSEEEKETLRMFYKRTIVQLQNDLQTLDVLVLDEVLDALQEELIEEHDLLSILKAAKNTEVILTGRKATDEILSLAVYVTTMHCDRHPYSSGLTARHGIEY